MAPARLLVFRFLPAFLLLSCAAQQQTANISAVQDAVRDRAFLILRGRTSRLVDVPLPANLSEAGVEASALRVRSSVLWYNGTNATTFRVPPGVVPAPYARRVTLVFERFLGNLSEAFFSPPSGYALAAPVVGLLAYDAEAGDDGELALQALGAPVRVEFKNLSSGVDFNATTARCLTFGTSGRVVATHAVLPGPACAVPGTGYFGVAVPVASFTAAGNGGWWVWPVGVGGGVAGVALAVAAVSGAVRWSRRWRRERMERRAAAGEELGRMSVRGSKMPSAKMVRTGPEAEAGMPSPWRKGSS